jgi:uncharacterized protein
MFSMNYLERAFEAVGPDHILFSTDYPYQCRSEGDETRFVSGLALGASNKAKCAYQNWEEDPGWRMSRGF